MPDEILAVLRELIGVAETRAGLKHALTYSELYILLVPWIAPVLIKVLPAVCVHEAALVT